jgi:hypothetical protein
MVYFDHTLHLDYISGEAGYLPLAAAGITRIYRMADIRYIEKPGYPQRQYPGAHGSLPGYWDLVCARDLEFARKNTHSASSKTSKINTSR